MEFSVEGPLTLPLWVNGHALLTVADDFFNVVNHATGQVIRRIPLCGAAEASNAVGAARAAQPEWAEMGMPARRVCLNRLADALEKYQEHFVTLLLEECGGDETSAMAEVRAAIAALREATVGASGVDGVALGAQRPLAGFAAILAPALLAGACLVVKPSPKAPSAIYALCELSARVEWPAGVLNLLQGDTAALEGLCTAGVDCLRFAGDAELG